MEFAETNYKFKWYAQSFHVMGILKEMRKTNNLTDVRLVCDDGKEVRAHKVVLCAHSQLMKQIFTSLHDDEALIYLTNTKYKDVITILDFMYLGGAKLDPDSSIDEIFTTANEFGFKEINNYSFKSGDTNCDVKMSFEPSVNEIIENKDQKQTISFEKEDKKLNKTMKYEAVDSVGASHNSKDSVNPSKTSEKIKLPKPTLLGNSCPDCNKYFEKSRYMKQHYHNIHGRIQITKCKVCEKEFLSKSRMLAHLNLVHNAIPKKCSDCGKSFSNATNLKTHYNSFHKGIKYECDQCDYVATQRGHLKEHNLSKHEGIVYTCNLCDKKYSQKKALKKHKCMDAETKHFDLYKFRRNREHLHKKKTHPTVCPDCGKSFASAKGMVVHYDSDHDGIRYSCNQCEKQFKQIGHLHMHIKSIHELVKYNCNKCEYQATQPQHLRNHILSKHEGIKFPCGQCSSQYSNKADLKKHLRVKHHDTSADIKIKKEEI